MYPTTNPEPNHAAPAGREMVDLLDALIRERILESQSSDHKTLKDCAFNIEMMKRQLTDYLLQTDPRPGIYVQAPGQ
jgi:hypothetical protein